MNKDYGIRSSQVRDRTTFSLEEEDVPVLFFDLRSYATWVAFFYPGAAPDLPGKNPFIKTMDDGFLNATRADNEDSETEHRVSEGMILARLQRGISRRYSPQHVQHCVLSKWIGRKAASILTIVCCIAPVFKTVLFGAGICMWGHRLL